MLSFKNKVITSVLAPVYNCRALPFIHVAKLFNKEKNVISLSANGIGSKDDPVYLTAHRGVSSRAPENSLPAYVEAVKLGYYSSECDIRLTSDNKWVLMHNDTIDKQLCQKGKVSDFTYDEIRKFTYKSGSNFWKYDDFKIASLEEYLDAFVGSNTRPQIEIKSETYDLLHTVVDAVKAKGLEKSAIIISFDLKQLKLLHEIDPDIELWYLIDKITEENIAEAKAIGDNVWLSPHFKGNTKESIQLALDAGIGLSFWTVNTLEDAKMLYDMGVRYIESDILCN